MPDRILDFSEEAAHLAVRYANLIVKRPEKPDVTIPLCEIAVVIASHPALTFTQAALAGLSSAGAVFITCDDVRLPVGMMIPLQGHYSQTERIARQLAAKVPVRKRLWQQIVQAKISAQASALVLETSGDGGLPTLATRVRSGDPENIEAQAARRYWLLIFGDEQFRRDREAEDTNRVLNYGYTVLRAMTARAVCAAGLHPSVGLHHHNRYSQFTLADDLMEPFRVVVDRAAVSIRKTWGVDAPLDKIVKAELLANLGARFVLGGEERSLFEILMRTATSLVDVFDGRAKRLDLPSFPEFFPDSPQAS